MTSTVLPSSAQTDDADLTSLGYEPSLHRKLGRYASFAAGFSFVSILTTIFQLFAFGYSFAGPAFFWTWPVVLIGQLLVALNFAELAARYPLSGAVYQWARRVGGETVGWFAGWFMALAQVVTAAAAAIAMQVVLPQLWEGFQLVGGDPALNTTSGAANAVVLGAILLVVTTVINSLGVKLMAHVNSVGVTCEIVGVAAVILALITAAQRGPDVVMDTTVLAGSDLGAVGAFMISGLMASTLLTLVVVPALYRVLFRDTDQNGDGHGDYGLEILGNLQVQGTEGNPVVFSVRGDERDRDSWDRILLAGDAPSLIQHATIEYSHIGVEIRELSLIIRGKTCTLFLQPIEIAGQFRRIFACIKIAQVPDRQGAVLIVALLRWDGHAVSPAGQFCADLSQTDPGWEESAGNSHWASGAALPSPA